MTQTLGSYLRVLLDNKGWTVQRLGKETGFSHSYAGILVRDEDPRTGKPIEPTIKTILTLARALNVPYQNLVEAYCGRDPEGWRQDLKKEQEIDAITAFVKMAQKQLEEGKF